MPQKKKSNVRCLTWPAALISQSIKEACKRRLDSLRASEDRIDSGIVLKKEVPLICAWPGARFSKDSMKCGVTQAAGVRILSYGHSGFDIFFPVAHHQAQIDSVHNAPYQTGRRAVEGRRGAMNFTVEVHNVR